MSGRGRLLAAAAGAAFLAGIAGGAAADERRASGRGMEYATFVLSGLDANGDGLLTREEFLLSGFAYFEEIDRDRDGLATQSEIADWYLAYLRS